MEIVRNNLIVAFAGILITTSIPLMTCNTSESAAQLYNHDNDQQLNDPNYQHAIRCLEREEFVREAQAVDNPDAPLIEFHNFEPLYIVAGAGDTTGPNRNEGGK